MRAGRRAQAALSILFSYTSRGAGGDGYDTILLVPCIQALFSFPRCLQHFSSFGDRAGLHCFSGFQGVPHKLPGVAGNEATLQCSRT